MKLFRHLSLVLVLASFISSCKKAPSDAPVIVTSITGKVADATTGTGLAGAQVTTSPATSSCITGSDGTYTISDLQAGQYTVTASKTGYNTNSATVTVAEGQSITADIALSQTAPELAASAQTMDFGSVQTNNTFTISNQTGVGTVNWQLSWDQTWMAVSPTSGSVTTNSTVVSVAVKRDSLSYGNYAGVIIVSSDHGSKQVNVVMVKQNPNAPQLTVKPTTLDFGNSANTLSLTIQNTGTGTLAWNAGSNSSWLTLSQTSGSATGTNPSIVNVSVNRSGLAANTYQGTITVTTNGGTQSVTVTMQVLSGTVAAPTLQIVGSPTATSITVGWTKSTETTFQSYKLFRSMVPGVDENSTLVTTITSASTNNYTDNNLNSGTTYYYRVFAYGTNGVGSGSNEVTATTTEPMETWYLTGTISINGTPGPRCLDALSDNDIWLTSGSDIWHYDGSSWTKNMSISQSSSDGNWNFSAIYILNDNAGWAVGGYQYGSDALYYYNGITWTKDTSSVLVSASFNVVVATSSSNVWAGGNDLYHFDGSKWSKYGLGTTVYDLVPISQSEIWALTYVSGSSSSYARAIYKYNGSGWSLIADLQYSSYETKSFSALSANDIWYYYSTGNSTASLGHYQSGTESLVQVSIGGSYNSIWTIDMISSNNGWCTDDNGYAGGLYHYDGTQWTSVKNPTTSPIPCISMISGTDGWAVASNGAVLHYTK